VAMLAGATIPVVMGAVILGIGTLGGIAGAALLLWMMTRGGS